MIVGLVGFAGVGKDTVGDILYGCGFKREAFAKPVKDATAVIFGWDRGRLEGRTLEDRAWREIPDEFWSSKFGYPFTPRMALQKMGTEVGRDTYHANLWVDAMQKRLGKISTNHVVITDARFPNEIKLINDLGGNVIRIKRGPDPIWFDDACRYNALVKIGLSKYPLPASLEKIHPSERDWCGDSGIRDIVTNDESIDHLSDKIEAFVAYYG